MFHFRFALRVLFLACFARQCRGLAFWAAGGVLVAAHAAVPVVGAGVFHACALDSSAAVTCWGSNLYGQLGTTTPEQSFGSTAPGRVGLLPPATALAVGDYFACALIAGGAARCWGNNNYGQLGNGSNFDSHVPVAVQNISGATAIASGQQHSCVLVGGGVKCWGYNGDGQLGNGTTTDSTTPVDVLGIRDAVAISVADFHSCAVLAGGSVQCWGYNGYGEIGDDTNLDRLAPVTVQGISGATAVATGYYHTCAVVQAGAVRCWGFNGEGQLGDGTDVRSRVPVAVVNVTGAVQVTAAYRHTCARLSDGTVKCWGQSNDGLLGDAGVGGGPPLFRSTAVTVSRLQNATHIAAGDTHSCAVQTNGTVQCWGGNGYGQLGIGTYVGSNVPVPVLGEGGKGLLNLVGLLPGGAGHADAVFAWAEKAYSQVFAGSGAASASISGYRYRAYAGGHFLAVNETGEAHLLYLGPLSGNAVADLGLLTTYIALAGN